MPGLSVTVAEQIEALRTVAGDKRRGAHPARARPGDRSRSSPAGRATSTPARAESLGFKAETSFDEIIRAHIEDELGGKWAQ